MSESQIAHAGYAKIISHVFVVSHSSFAWLYRHKKCILMGSSLLFKPSSKETTMVKLVFSHTWQSVSNYESP